MQSPSRIPELVQRERFVRRLTAGRALHFVAGQEGWATVPFRHDASREVVLFWTDRREAETWADVVAATPTVYEVSIGQLLAEVLPMLALRGCLVGHDWSADPSDPVIEPGELAERIWRERTDAHITAIRSTGTVWLLESAGGPAMLPSLRLSGSDCLPVWADRNAAAAAATGSWANKRPLGVSLKVFHDRYLPFLEQRGGLIAPEPLALAGSRELTPSEFATVVFPHEALARLRAV